MLVVRVRRTRTTRATVAKEINRPVDESGRGDPVCPSTSSAIRKPGVVTEMIIKCIQRLSMPHVNECLHKWSCKALQEAIMVI
jgi:hypothetical protein